MKSLAFVLLASMTAALGTSARAEEPKWIQVEVLLFANKDTAAAAEETWPADPGAPDTAGALNLTPPAPKPKVVTAAATAVRPALQAYAALPAELFQLMDAQRQLARNGHYAPLLHLAWLQPASGADAGRPVHLLDAQNGIEGVVALAPGKPALLAADVVYRPQPAGAGPAPGYRLKARRQLRLQELNYLDHPVFGMLVLISPYSVPGAAPAAAHP